MNHLHHEGFREITKVDDALRTFFGALRNPKIKIESVTIEKSLGRTLGEDIVAQQFVPATDRSVMDGYAVRSEDVRKASKDNPSVLRIIGESRLGEICRSVVRPGTAVAVATGSTMPPGSDTVVIIERTERLSREKVAVFAPAEPGSGVSKRGEDVAPGNRVLEKGRALRSQDIGILKALGFRRVRVAKKPRVGIISTGNELVDSARGEGARVVDINRPILSAMTEESGGEPIDIGIVGDNEDEIIRAIQKGLKTADIVLISAGSSVGKKDLVPDCINRVGKPGMLVHGIAIRPALPTGLAVVNGKPILSLPGFPVSTIVAFRVFGRPLISKLTGSVERVEPSVKATLRARISGAPGYRTFVRVRVTNTEQGLVADPIAVQRSSVLMSVVGANGIVTIPEDITAFEAGQLVDVSLIGEIPA